MNIGDGISIMDNVNIWRMRKCFSWTNLRSGGAVLRFQRRDWISLYELSFNLAALERLCCHAVRYFHPPARFLNGETVPRTFHISDFCRGRSRIARDLPGYPVVHISPVQSIQYRDSDKNLGDPTARRIFFFFYSVFYSAKVTMWSLKNLKGK